jgi:hypothetical protein
MAEVSIDGVFVPTFLVWLVVAVVVTAVAKRALAAAGFYDLVWHRPLFDLALTVVVFGGVVALAARMVGP